MEMENKSPKSPTNAESDEAGELFPTNHRQSLSGSMGKLPSTNTEANTLDVEPAVKCRSTTPPATMKAVRSRSHTWSQVKGLIIKNVRENKKSANKNLKQTLSYPASPGGENASSDQAVNSISETLSAQPEAISASASTSSSSSSSPSLSYRPNTLDLADAPKAPPRVKKKKSKLTSFNPAVVKKPRCIDLRSSGQNSGIGGGGAVDGGGRSSGSGSSGAFTSRMMKKFRKRRRLLCNKNAHTNFGANMP
jgi:hypothetical protein